MMVAKSLKLLWRFLSLLKINEKEKTVKIYRNSCCLKCYYEYDGELKVKKHPITNKDIVICASCWSKLQKELKND